MVGGNGKHHGDCTDKDTGIDQDTPFEQDVPTIEDTSESKFAVIGAAESIYYASKNQDIYITIHLSNPSGFEIVSFTLNAKKWANYMFEPGSDLENLILKLNVGDVAGIVEYTIDAIKYIDGEEIKDVVMSGEKTVKAGIPTDNQIYTSVSNESSTLTEISFDASITDTYSLIQKSGGYAKAVLYDGINIVEKDITEGERLSVKFDDLLPNTMYQYGIVAYFDDLSGSGPALNILYKKAIYTKVIVLFDSDKINITKTSVDWDYMWDSGISSPIMKSLSLWKGEEKIRDLEASVKSVDNLLTDNAYSIKAKYDNLNGEEEEIYFSFTTYANVVPTVEITNVASTQTSINFGINVTDTDNVGSITKIELLHGNDEPIIVTSLTQREFTSLLSNNEYTVQVTYEYDLNDGIGVQSLIETSVKQTKAKATPTVEISNVSSTQTSVTFDITETDADSVGSITKIELLHGNDAPIVASNLTQREFTGLLSNNDYTIQLTYEYDLNDGVGVQIFVETSVKQTK